VGVQLVRVSQYYDNIFVFKCSAVCES